MMGLKQIQLDMARRVFPMTFHWHMNRLVNAPVRAFNVFWETFAEEMKKSHRPQLRLVK